MIQYATGDGKDVVFGFGGEDSIEVTSGAIRTYVQSGANTIFYIGGGTANSITIRNSSRYDFSVDGNVICNYGANGMLVTDDNFISDETNLDAICAENYSVTQIETGGGFETLADDKTLLAYTDK